jgi:hypothetical protein
MTIKPISPKNRSLKDWLTSNGNTVQSIIEAVLSKSDHEIISKWSTQTFPSPDAVVTDEMRMALRMGYWRKLLESDYWSKLVRLVPYTKVKTPEDLELIYSVTRVALGVPTPWQRVTWLPHHQEGMEEVPELPPLPQGPSITDDWATLVDLQIQSGTLTVALPEQVPDLIDEGQVTPEPVPEPVKSTPATNPKLEESNLLFELSKYRAKAAKTSKKKNHKLQLTEPAPTLIPAQEEVVRTDPSEDEIANFNAHRDDTVDPVDAMYHVTAKQNNLYQTGPLVALSKALCGVTHQVPEDILSSLRRDIPKLDDTKYVITNKDLDAIKKGRSEWTAKKAQLFTRWAYDALDCASEVPMDMTIKHYTLMLPADLTLRHKSDLLIRAKGNLEMLHWYHNVQDGERITETEEQDAMKQIANGVTLSALHNAKSTIEPIAAAVLAKLLSLEADTQQTVADLTRQVDRLIASNTSTENANNNLYKTFSVWAESFHGKTDEELGGLLKGRGKSGVDTISELSRVSRTGSSVSQMSDSRSSSIVSKSSTPAPSAVYKRPVSKLSFIKKPE